MNLALLRRQTDDESPPFFYLADMLLPTTLLYHAAPAAVGPHYDWLIVDPATLGQCDGQLWTARVGHPWSDWRTLGRFTLTPLPPHRRRYLSWQGNLSAGRGHVRTAARGHVQPHLWTPHRKILTLHPPPLPPPFPPLSPPDFPPLNPSRTGPLTLELTGRGEHLQATLLAPSPVPRALPSRRIPQPAARHR